MIVPSLDLVRVLVALTIAAVVFLSGWTIRGASAERDIAKLKQEHSDLIAEQERTYSRDVVRVMDRSHELVEKAGKETSNAQAQNAALAATRSALLAESHRLREQVFRAAQEACSPTDRAASAPGGEAGAGPGLVLAKLWGSAEEEAVELGPALDDAIARGLRCERLYDNVRQASESLRKEP